MKKITVSAPIQPKKLNSDERALLTDQLHAVHCQIFDGVDRDAFRRYVIEPDTVLTKIFLFRNRAEEVVGYLTFQVFQVEIHENGKNRKPYVYRTETGILPAYRGKTPIANILVKECFKFSLSHGIPEAYFMATPINPVPYCIADRSAAQLYPRPGVATPSHITAIKDQLSASLHLETADPNNRFVKKVGWMVRLNTAQVNRLQRSANPAIQFYLEQNPDFLKGNGMMMLAPATIGNGLKSVWKMLRFAFSRKSQRLAYSLPLFIRPVALALAKI